MKYTHHQTTAGQRPPVSRRLTGWLFAFMGFAALAAMANAQTATITGRVLNQATGDYLKYAQIQIVGSDKSAITEDGGTYTLTNVPAGEVKLTVSYTGLDTQEVTVTVPATGAVKQDINLSSAQYGETVTLGEFRVASSREGNAKAIVDQKAAMNFKVVIASDAFGDIAEGNAGEFLKLMPGISLDYVANDTRQVRGRGLPPQYTSITMDGNRIASASSGAVSRAFELEQFSLVATEQVETIKTPTSDMESDGLGTVVNYKSKSGFDKQGRRVDWQVNSAINNYDRTLEKSAYAEGKISKVKFGGNVTYSDVFQDKLGVVVAINESNVFNEQRRSQSALAYTVASLPLDKNGNPAPTVSIPTASPEIGSQITHVNQYQAQDGPKTTNRRTGALFLDYKVTDDLMASFRFQNNRYSNNFRNRNITWATSELSSSSNNTKFTDPSLSPGTGITVLSQQSNEAIDFITFTPSLTAVAANPYVIASPAGSTLAGSPTTTISGSFRDKYGSTIVLNPELTYKIGQLKVDGAVSYSRSRNNYADMEHGFFNTINGLKLNDPNKLFVYEWIQDGPHDVSPTIKVLNGPDPYSLTSYVTNWQAQSTPSRAQDEFYTAHLNAQYDFDTTVPIWVKGGLATREQGRDIHTPANHRYGLTTAGVAKLNGNATIADTSYNRPGVYGQTQPQYPNLYLLYRDFWDNGSGTYLTDKADSSGTKASEGQNLANDYLGASNIKEQVDSAYVMGDIKIQKLELTAGVRMEHTRSRGRGASDIGNRSAIAALIAQGYKNSLVAANGTLAIDPTGFIDGTAIAPDTATVKTVGAGGVGMRVKKVATAGGVTTTTYTYTNSPVADPNLGALYAQARYGAKVESTQDYTDVFPNLQGKYKITKNLQARASFSTSILRPDFANLVPTPVITDSSTPYSIALSNPNLTAEKGKSYDVAIEYYFEPVGNFSAGVFRKEISNTQVAVSGPLVVGGGLNPLWNGDANAQALADLNDSNYNGASVTKVFNAGSTRVDGIELSYSQQLSFLPGLLKGTGVFLNYTHVNPSIVILNTPTNVINGGLNYRYGRFDMQLKANYLSRSTNSVNLSSSSNVVKDAAGNILGSDSNSISEYRYRESQLRFDLNVNFKLFKYVTLFANARNLFNEPEIITSVVSNHVYRQEEFGCNYTVGLKGTF